MKIFLVVILILMSIYLFSENGPQMKYNVRTMNHDPQLSTNTLPSRAGMLFASHDMIANNFTSKVPTPASTPAEAVAPAELNQQPVHTGLTVYPNADEALLWVMADEKQDINGLDIQVFNSAGKRVYYSKMESKSQKVDLCCYENGKYVVKVGGQSYRLMLIQ